MGQFWLSQIKRCYWHQVGKGQGCCKISYNVEVSLPQQNVWSVVGRNQIELETTVEKCLKKAKFRLCATGRFWDKMVQWKDLALTSSPEHTKIITNCWTTISKKDFLHPKRMPQEMAGGVHSQYNQIPHSTGLSNSQTGEYIAEVLQQEWEFWAPSKASQPGSGIRRRSLQCTWLRRPAGLDCRSSPGLG